MVEGETGPEDSGHQADNAGYARFARQTHRIIGLICRYPFHRWRFKVWQFLLLKHHAADCYECNMRLDDLTRRYPQKPTIGPAQERN